MQIYCVDSVDMESWYNRRVPPRWRIARHVQYEDYLMHEVLPLSCARRTSDPHLVALGCSFGGYHATNIALRHPDVFSGLLSMSGAFDLSNFLDGYYDQDCYFNLPTHYLPNLSDPWYLDRYRPQYLCAGDGMGRPCLGQNQNLDRILSQKRFRTSSISGTHTIRTTGQHGKRWCRNISNAPQAQALCNRQLSARGTIFLMGGKR